MKKLLFALVSVFVSVVASADTGDRLDACRADGTCVSFIADEVASIAYGKANPADDGYAYLDILFSSGEKQRLELSEFPVLKYVHSDCEFLEILRVDDEHSSVILYDCRNNDFIMSEAHPEDWRAEEPGGMPHFRIQTEPGYTSECKVVGQYTGRGYTSDPYFLFFSSASSNKLLINTLSFVMPEEPVYLKAVSEELSTYEGRDFVGTYKGYELEVGSTRLVKGHAPAPFTARLLANGSYRISSTDSNQFDLAAEYTYNESTGRFAYVPVVFDAETSLGYSVEYARDYGADGQFFDGGYAFIEISDLVTDKAENARLYLTGKEDFDVVCAFRDAYGSQALVEVVPATGERRWFLLENNGALRREATVDFRRGTTIGEACEAIVSIDGTSYLKYTLADGGEPQLQDKGREAGSYVSGDGRRLQLDGFGEASLDGVAGTYSVEGQIVSFSDGDAVRRFLVDIAAGTCKELSGNDEWDGAVSYGNGAVYGVYAGSAPTYDNSVNVTIGYNLIGAEKPGYAAVSASIRHDGRYFTVVADCQPYVYDAAARQLTITNVLVGLPEGGSARQNLVMRLSEDKKSLYLEGEGKIYSTSDPGSYVLADAGNALKAPETLGFELAGHYEGEYKVGGQGSDQTAAARLVFDKDLDGSDREGYASFTVTVAGQALIASCAAYEIKNGKLLLKDVTVGDGNGGTKSVDLSFSPTEEEALLGEGTYAGASASTSALTVDLGSGLLLPPTGGLPEGWNTRYEGNYYSVCDGEESTVANVSAVLLLDSDSDGNAKPGYASLQINSSAIRFVSTCVEYEISGDALRLVGVPVKENGEEGVLTFVRGEDGSLLASGILYSTNYSGAFSVDLSHAKLSPQE